MGLPSSKQNILIVTAVERERDAVLQGLGQQRGIDVLVGGIGPIVSAVTTTQAMTKQRYELVINMGIGGGFRGKAELGSIVVASEMVAAQFGVETPTGFRFADVNQLGSSKIVADKRLCEKFVHAFQAAGLKALMGPILTVSTVTGTEATALELQRRVPNVTAEGMEGFGVATAGRLMQATVLEIRAISNIVGKRDKSKWRIDDALASLAKASRVLMEVL